MNLNAMLDQLARDAGALCDIAELALELARDEYPDLDVEAYLSELDGMASEAKMYVRGNLEARVKGLCRYLFHEMGFRGNRQDYYDPRNSYLNEVLDRRIGIPISLSVVALAVGSRTGLHVEGVGLPGHFIAKAVEGDREVLFDPFHGGRLLEPEQCERLVARVTGKPFHLTPESLHAIPLGPMVERMLMNLKATYVRDGHFAKAIRVMERRRQLRPDDVEERRDLGLALLRIHQPGKALDHLTAYLSAGSAAADAEMVRAAVRRARSEIAAWN